MAHRLNLQLFAEGGDGAGAAPISGAEGIQAEKSGSSHRNRGNKSELADVVYGIQDTEADTGSVAKSKPDVTTTSNTLEDKKAAFKELIDGEYKEEFTEMFQQRFDRRFKDYKNLEAQVNQVQPIIDMLMQKYKITDGDIEALSKAIDTDDTYWEEAAEEAGLTVEQYKAVQKLERENAEFRRAAQQAEGQKQMEAQVSDWYKQAEAVKQIYPDFDLKVESQNRDFLGLLKAGIPVQQAYETMHLSELVSGAARVAAQQAEQNVVAGIKSKASRPSENGTSSQSSATIKSDVSSLTRADREEIARRVARGETIKF